MPAQPVEARVLRRQRDPPGEGLDRLVQAQHPHLRAAQRDDEIHVAGIRGQLPLGLGDGPLLVGPGVEAVAQRRDHLGPAAQEGAPGEPERGGEGGVGHGPPSYRPGAT
jgi:hypothetical protein